MRQPDEMPWILGETAAMRAVLGDAAFTAAVQRGRELTIEEAVARGPRPRALTAGRSEAADLDDAGRSGASRARTDDLRAASATLSQLSYSPGNSYCSA